MTPPSRRRTKEVVGCVNFPINQPDWKNTGEGGTFVRLVVEDLPKYGDKWSPCSGGEQHVLYDESFHGDDVNPEPPPLPTNWDDLTPEEARASLEKSNKWPAEEYHFPRIKEDPTKDPDTGIHGKYLSIPYLAIITIGATGWTGWNEKENRSFRCTYDDLLPIGKKLYDCMQALYPGRTIFLQTWIDT